MTNSASATLKTISDNGTGRPFVLLFESGAHSEVPRLLAEALSSRTRVLLVESARITDRDWEPLTQALVDLLGSAGIRQASFVSFGACGALVQAMALRELKLVRTIVLIDASTRPHPSSFSRLVDRLEGALPLGLPLRLEQSGFDAKPFLQRIRCPVLVVTSSRADQYQIAEAEVLEAGLPTAWRVTTAASEETAKLTELVLDFQEVQAKCPQKKVTG